MSGGLRRFIGMARPGSEADLQPGVPAGWVSSGEAGRLLGLSRGGARKALVAAGVRSRSYLLPGCSSPRLMWSRTELERFAERRAAEVRAVSHVEAGMCTVAEACEILGVSESSVDRYMKRGMLEGEKVRVWRGSRRVVIWVFRRTHVRALARRRCAGMEEVRRRVYRRNGAAFARSRALAGGSG